MLSEGGIRVPFIMHWPNTLAAGQKVYTPVSTLDAAFTALKWSGETNLNELDGIDLIPVIDGKDDNAFERTLFWRFLGQKAVRKGKWKYIQAGKDREYLFDMTSAPIENNNLIDQYPEVVNSLNKEYQVWAKSMLLPEVELEISDGWKKRYDYYFPSM